MATLKENGTLPLAGGPTNGHAAPEIGADGRLGAPVSGSFRRVPSGLMESYTPQDAGLFSDLYWACHAGDLKRALLITETYAGRSYSRGLREGVVHTDLDVALDGSVRTTVFDAWKEVAWPWLEVVELMNFSDYESHKLDTLSEINIDDETNNTRASGTLPVVLAGASYNEAEVGEKYETVQIKDYGCTFSITERALRADDKNVLPGLPKLLGRVAKRTVSANVAAILEVSGTGPTMTEDSVACFNAASHSNLVASAIAHNALVTGVAAIAGQSAYAGGAATRVMGLRARWLIVPSALELSAAALIAPAATTLNEASTAGSPTSAFNALAGRMQLSVWPDLTDTNGWFLATDKGDFPHIVVPFLDGNQEPILEVQGSVGPDLSDPVGKKYRVRLPHGVGLKDWRGLYCSTGAS